ncbi:MAG: PaaI family thioesterase [Vicinamibacteria bacterium]|nr:PaaI family thioesterase [Vicinamibacteria bacterium]
MTGATRGSAAEVVRLMEEFSPFNRWLGIRGVSAEPGRVTMAIDPRPEHTGDPVRPALHGGVISALIDTAGGAAAWTALPPGENVSTVDLLVDYLEPGGFDAPLVAEAVLLRRGNRVCHVRVVVRQGERLVAEGRAVYNIHRRRKEKEEKD